MTPHNLRPFTTTALFGVLKRLLPDHLLLALFGRRITIPLQSHRRARRAR